MYDECSRTGGYSCYGLSGSRKGGDGASSHDQVAGGLCLSAACGWQIDRLVGRGGEQWLCELVDHAFLFFFGCVVEVVGGGLVWERDMGVGF